MAEPVLPDGLREELERIQRELYESLYKKFKLYFLKCYPQITKPESGDEIILSTTPNIAVKVKSNFPGQPHKARLYNEMGLPASNEEPVNFAIVGGKPVGTAMIPTPAVGEYLIFCYVEGENLGAPVHHVAKVPVTVKT